MLKKGFAAPLFCMALSLMIAGGAALALLPERSFSDLENRPLAEWPSSGLFSENFDEQAERYAADHFPLRDLWIQADATFAAAVGDRMQDGVLLGKEGWLFEEPQGEINQTAQYGMETLCEAAEELGLPFSLMLIPSSAAVMDDKLPTVYDAPDQMALLRLLYEQANGLRTIDSMLEEHAGDDSLYYKTDHHLTAEGAWICYEQICKAWELTPVHTQQVSETGFLGSYYARLPGAQIKPDVFTAEIPEGIRLTVDGKPRDSMLDREAMKGRNKYAALIAGTYAHAVIENPQGEGVLLMVSDSYANAVAPLLAQHFARVDMVDPRYFTGSLESVVCESGSDRCIALFGLNTFCTNRGLALLRIGEETW